MLTFFKAHKIKASLSLPLPLSLRIENVNYFLNSQKLVSLGTNLNIFHFNVIGLSAPIARLAGHL